MMTRRLLGYLILADGILVTIFDGGYVRMWRPMVPNRLIGATRRAYEIHPFLSRLVGIAEIGAGLAMVSFAESKARREKARAKTRAARRKAA